MRIGSQRTFYVHEQVMSMSMSLTTMVRSIGGVLRLSRLAGTLLMSHVSTSASALDITPSSITSNG